MLNTLQIAEVYSGVRLKTDYVFADVFCRARVSNTTCGIRILGRAEKLNSVLKIKVLCKKFHFKSASCICNATLTR
jgi:hypothetical protein